MQLVKQEIQKELEKNGVKNPKIEKPPENIDADLSFPCFNLAKEFKKSPVEIAKDFSGKLKPKYVKGVKPLGPYVNFYIDWGKYGEKVLQNVLNKKEKYGGFSVKNKKALVEHTSINPNASPHVGRARNAIIGDSLVRILKFLGYSVETHYFVNDIGKQIALLVWGCKKKKDLDFSELLKIYIKANEKMEKEPKIEKEIFGLLADFEKGDKKVMDEFHRIVSICIEGQKKILEELNIKYDFFDFESDYLVNKRTDEVLKMLENTGKVFVDEEKRKVLDLKGFDIPMENPVFVLTRSDGTSLYGLRDISYTIDKIKRGKDFNALVLGEDQKLYFKQLSSALSILGYKSPQVIHYSFVLLAEGKMSTRKGNIVLLEDFMKKAFDLAYKEIDQRYPELERGEKENRAKAVSVAAVRYNIAKAGPEKNITFDIKEATKFEGDTGPYIQYSYARARSILKKSVSGEKKFSAADLKEEKEIQLLKKLSEFPEIIEKATAELQPHLVANYVFDLATAFNEFYQTVPVLKAESRLLSSRLALVDATSVVLKTGLNVLGIDALEEM